MTLKKSSVLAIVIITNNDIETKCGNIMGYSFCIDQPE